MDKQNQTDKLEQKNNEIRLNKKMRLWNKYKNYIFGLAGILIIIILAFIILKGCGKSTDEGKNTTSAIQNNASSKDAGNGTKSAADQTKTAGETATQANTQAVTANKVYTTNRTVTKEDLTATSFYDNAAFLGDSIVDGIGYYGFLPKNKIIADTNLTTDKAMNNIDELVSTSPQKVFIMLGINDLNYGSKSVDTITGNYQALIKQIKAKLPTAKIYIISVLPITQAYEAKSNVYIKKANLDQLNNNLKAFVASEGVDYLDLTSAFQNGTGYLNESVTNNGLNISNDYYGFLLNTIADMLK